MKDLSSRVKKTPQALYSLIKQNQALSSLIKEHSTKNGRLVSYDEAVLDWLLSYYGTEEGNDQRTPIDEKTDDSENGTDQIAAAIETAALRSENERLKEQLEMIRVQLSKSEEERSELLKQNGNLLLLLNQEKAEKQALLPEPKKTFREWVSGIFGKKQGE